MKLIDVLKKLKIKDLKKEIASQNIKGYSKLKKNELVKLMMDREDRFKYLLLNNMNQKKELLVDKIKLKEAKDKMKNIINKKSNLHIVTKQDVDDIKRINKKNDAIDDNDYSYLGITNEQADDITYGKKKAILVKATKKTRTPLQAKVIKPVKKTPMMATIKKAEVKPKETSNIPSDVKKKIKDAIQQAEIKNELSPSYQAMQKDLDNDGNLLNPPGNYYFETRRKSFLGEDKKIWLKQEPYFRDLENKYLDEKINKIIIDLMAKLDKNNMVIFAQQAYKILDKNKVKKDEIIDRNIFLKKIEEINKEIFNLFNKVQKPEVKKDLSDDEKELEKLDKKQINLENRLSSIKKNRYDKNINNLIQSTQKELLEVKLSIYELKDKMKGKDEKEFNNKDKGNIKEFEKLVKKFIKKPTKQLLDDIDNKFELVDYLDDEIAEELEFQIDKFEKGQKKNKKKLKNESIKDNSNNTQKMDKKEKGLLTDKEYNKIKAEILNVGDILTYYNDLKKVLKEKKNELIENKTLSLIEKEIEMKLEYENIKKSVKENNLENYSFRSNIPYDDFYMKIFKLKLEAKGGAGGILHGKIKKNSKTEKAQEELDKIPQKEISLYNEIHNIPSVNIDANLQTLYRDLSKQFDTNDNQELRFLVKEYGNEEDKKIMRKKIPYDEKRILIKKNFKKKIEIKQNEEDKDINNYNFNPSKLDLKEHKNLMGDKYFKIYYKDNNVRIDGSIPPTKPTHFYLDTFQAQSDKSQPRAKKGMSNFYLCEILKFLLKNKKLNKTDLFKLTAGNISDGHNQLKLNKYYESLDFKKDGKPNSCGDQDYKQTISSFINNCEKFKIKKEIPKLTEIEEIKKRLKQIENIKGGLMNPHQKKELKLLLDEREELRQKELKLLKKKLKEEPPKPEHIKGQQKQLSENELNKLGYHIIPKYTPKPKKEPLKPEQKPAPKPEPKKTSEEVEIYRDKILESNKKIKLFNNNYLTKILMGARSRYEMDLTKTDINDEIDNIVKNQTELDSKTDIQKDIDVFKKGGKMKDKMYHIIDNLEKMMFKNKSIKPTLEFIDFLTNETNKREKLYITVKIQKSFNQYCNKLNRLKKFIKNISDNRTKGYNDRIKFLEERCLELIDIIDKLQTKFNITYKQIKDNELMIF